MLIAGFALSCGGDDAPPPPPKSTAAGLTSITIKDKAPDKIPEPISQADLDEQTFTDPKYTGTVYLNDETELASAVVAVEISAGAKAVFGLAAGFSAPDAFSSETALPTITLGQALYVKVTAEDGTTVAYYRFSILMLSDNSQLRTLTVAEISAELGAAGTAWNNAAAGTIGLSNAKKADAKIVGTPANLKAKVEYAKVTGSGAPGAYSDTDVYTFADGDTLYVRVTAENGQRFSYYKVTVQIGRDATLASVTIGTTTAEALGTPKTSWASFTAAQRGSCQVDERMPETGFTVVVTPNDEEAAVGWVSIGRSENSSTTAPAAFNGTSPFIFPSDISDVAIKVTSANGSTTRYYRIRLVTKSWSTIYKGTPKLENPSDPGDKQYIDPIWNNSALFTDDGEGDMKGWLDVSRINTAESFDAWFATDEGRHTTARAKALWDDDGLWVYCDVDFRDYTDKDGAKIRTASLSGIAGTYTPGTDVTVTSNSTPNDAHMRDTVELFINERFQTFKTGNYGNQYRSGLPNATDGTIWLSGEKGNPPTTPAYFNSITQFQIDKKVNSWVKKNAADKEIGYVIIMRAQWVKLYTSDIDAVFDTEGKVKDGAEIGMELQVNACATEGVRNGILTWNGITSQAYQNVKSFGIVTLKTSK